jgi:catechol 2,3-dioxygenase-like lactoylglutathione lyase family enzyme
MSRRELVSASALLTLAIVIGSDRSSARSPGLPPSSGASARAVGAIGVTVSNLAASVAFFRDVLAFEVLDEREDTGRDTELLTGVFGARTRTARLRLGREVVELTEFLAPRGRPFPADTRGNDQWFQHVAIIVSDMDAAYARLRAAGVVHASTGPQRLPDWNPNAGGIKAFYFKDPDGHFLEVLQFPPGKGEARWQARDRLFLGIDHTAIVSTDTARSLRFYHEGLGLAVAGGAENHGLEQEHLNNVFGVRLKITTLRAPHGPGVELLEYLAPRTGRATPGDFTANDLAHWQTTVEVPSVERHLHALLGGWLVSPVVVAAAPGQPFTRGLLVRDPDAHGVRLVEH